MYFDPRNKRRAWVNIQHPDSDNDRTIEITIAREDDDEDEQDWRFSTLVSTVLLPALAGSNAPGALPRL